jgi:thioesterase domain-containing protein
MYKTGDLALYQADGKIEFLGRNDFQVKIRGFRIEPGEVEAKLIGHPGVREAVVMAREEDGASKWLVAYYTGEEIGAEALRAHLSSALPEYMLPSAYIRLESLPLTPNGKLDRRALHAKPAPEWEAYVRQGYEPPMGETETLLARIWADLLKLDRVGRHDNFFELGGHSLLAVRLKAQVRERLGFELPQSVFFTRPTIAGLAAALDLSDLRRDGPLVPLRLIGERAPLFLVHAAGGGLFSYRELTRALPARRPIYGLERPGFESGEVEELDVERLAARYLEPVTRRQPHGPYAIAGWSFGGMVAFEMARQLRSAGEPVAFLGLIDTRPPLGDALSRLDPLAMRMDLDTNGLFDREARILGETLNEAAGKRLQAMLDAHERAMLRYAPGGEIDAERVALFRAVASKTGFRNSQYWEGWQSLSRSPIEQHTITGDHYSIMEPPQAAFLAEALARALGDL